ncbi:MAG: sulfite oxidase [Pseudonocardiales bacterium]|nr:sulfite oxidase [Pseudonocardiales bacterium]
MRNHGPVPINAPDQFRLTIDGLVDQNTEWSLDQLGEQFPTHELPVTLQCAGNRRAGYLDVRDIPGEDPWGPAATSTATWTGLRLGDLLRAVGPTHDAEHVLFGAPDVSDLATPPQRFGGSIPLSKALSGEVLLAWGMNGQPLPATHGAPLRVVVPGYIGARSVKGLDRITLAAQASDNYFQATAYRLLPAEADPTTAGHGDGISLGPIALNSEILSPDDGATVPAGTTHVTGYALAGEDRGVARVDVSLDNGRTWIRHRHICAGSPPHFVCMPSGRESAATIRVCFLPRTSATGGANTSSTPTTARSANSKRSMWTLPPTSRHSPPSVSGSSVGTASSSSPSTGRA